MKASRGSRSGLYAPRNPHFSFTQLYRVSRCLAWHEAEYERGLKRRSRVADWGSAVHAAIEAINRTLKANPDGIRADDIEDAKRKLIRFAEWGEYRRACEWLDEYAARANDERAGIIGVEVPIWYWIRLGAIKANPRKVWIMDMETKKWTRGISRKAMVRVEVRIDRLDRGPAGNDCIVTDYKTFGRIPTREDGRDMIQFDLEALALRQPHNADRFGLNPRAMFTARWESIYHGRGRKPAEWGLDVVNADDAERFAGDKIRDLIERRDRPATFHSDCAMCPLSEGAKCATFRREIGAAPGAATLLKPSADEYLKLTTQRGVIDKVLDKMRPVLAVRLEQHGKPIEEGGAIASLAVRKGGLPEKYEGLTRDEIIEELTREASTHVSVRATGIRR